MVAKYKDTEKLLEKVAEIYNWLDLQTGRYSNLAGVCRACGDCCDFDSPATKQRFDHRLFVTTPELLYLAANASNKNIRPMERSRCPYNVAGKCEVYEYRFAGCRIFCCRGDADFQSRLSESALKKFKSICTEFQIPYRYSDLVSALNSLLSG